VNDDPLFDCTEAQAVLIAARAAAVALVRDGVLYNASLMRALDDAIERWGRLIVLGERVTHVEHPIAGGAS
jgi:hypothetical protein